jgi:FkbM family methyltransferase
VLEVIGFEPDGEECERLNRDAGSLGYPVRFLPYGLWRETAERVPFHVCNWPVASSIYRPNAAFLRSFPNAEGLFGVKEVRMISTRCLDEVCGEEGLSVDCLKLDVEGAELDVLLGGERALAEALVLEVEVEFQPLFEDQPLFADIDGHLRERGWSLLGLRRNCWRRDAGRDRSAPGDGGQLVQADALYWSASASDAGLSPPRELKLLVALAAYRQFDIVLARLRGSTALTRDLGAAELRELETVLVPRPGRLRRLARRVVGRFDAERRRAAADRLQPGDAGIWHDPHYF